MSKITFAIGCTQKKAPTARYAGDLYLSDRFLAAKKIAEDLSAPWVILSAKHGILPKNQIADPYDFSLDKLTDDEYRKWVSQCSDDLLHQTSPNDHVIFLGDFLYFSDIKDVLNAKGRKVFIPLEYVQKEYHHAWLDSYKIHRIYIDRFYTILDHYAEKYNLIRDFSACNDKSCCPEYGLYIFMHKDERRLLDPSRSRVARIGTHAVSDGSKATLWQRLKTHKGTSNGFGNHRSSIFRSYVGSAIIKEYGLCIDSWEQDVSTKHILESEKDIEKQVSCYLNENFKLICLNIPGIPSKTSDRAYIERNIIALLSSTTKFSDTPPADWLGRYAPSEIVKQSGLWNVNHTEEIYSYEFFGILEEYFKFSCGLLSSVPQQLAPHGWNANRKSRNVQLTLF